MQERTTFPQSSRAALKPQWRDSYVTKVNIQEKVNPAQDKHIYYVVCVSLADMVGLAAVLVDNVSSVSRCIQVASVHV